VTDAEALAYLARIDHLRQTGAAAAGAAEALLHQLQTTGGKCPNRAYAWLGMPASVVKWCKAQAALLERRDPALLAELVNPPPAPDAAEIDEDEPDLHQLLIDWCRRT